MHSRFVYLFLKRRLVWMCFIPHWKHVLSWNEIYAADFTPEEENELTSDVYAHVIGIYHLQGQHACTCALLVKRTETKPIGSAIRTECIHEDNDRIKRYNRWLIFWNVDERCCSNRAQKKFASAKENWNIEIINADTASGFTFSVTSTIQNVKLVQVIDYAFYIVEYICLDICRVCHSNRTPSCIIGRGE